MKKYRLISVLTILVCFFAVGFTHFTFKSLNNFKDEKKTIAQELNFEERLMSASEWLPFGSATETKLAEYKALKKSAEAYYQTAVRYGLVLFIIVLIYLATIAVYYWKTKVFFQMFGISLIMSSLCFIYLGLQAPFLEIEAFSNNLSFKVPIDLGIFEHTFEKTFEGKISFFYQSKSVFDLIYLLFMGGNVLVGIALLLFSIIFPLFKLLSSLYVLLFPKGKYAIKFEYFIKIIGKWSMADVFVAAIFLAYFSFSNMNFGVETNSKALIGLYFFLAFVIASILSSYFVQKARAISLANELESEKVEFIG